MYVQFSRTKDREVIVTCGYKDMLPLCSVCNVHTYVCTP